MGIVQLMAPPGTPPVGISPDGTNTVLDDNIKVFRLGKRVEWSRQAGSARVARLPERAGPGRRRQRQRHQPTGSIDYEGDIRPAPVFLPSPFADKSRLRSNWIDTGSSVRRSLTADDNLPRGIIDPTGTLTGPRYLFAGLNPTTGYVDYTVSNGTARPNYPEVVPPTPITGTGGITFLGEPAYFVRTAGAFGTPVDQFSQYEAELLNDNNLLQGSFRILANTESELTLSAERGRPRDQTRGCVPVLQAGDEDGTGPKLNLLALALRADGQRCGSALLQDPANPTALRWRRWRAPSNTTSRTGVRVDPRPRPRVRNTTSC
jgi:hypothetical protein